MNIVYLLALTPSAHAPVSISVPHCHCLGGSWLSLPSFRVSCCSALLIRWKCLPQFCSFHAHEHQYQIGFGLFQNASILPLARDCLSSVPLCNFALRYPSNLPFIWIVRAVLMLCLNATEMALHEIKMAHLGDPSVGDFAFCIVA